MHQVTELKGYFKSLEKITTNRLSYALGLHGEKKLMINWNIIKNGHSEDDTYDISKPGHFNSLGGILKLPPKLLKFPGLLVLKRSLSAKIKYCCYFSHPLDDRHGTSHEALGTANIVVET